MRVVAVASLWSWSYLAPSAAQTAANQTETASPIKMTVKRERFRRVVVNLIGNKVLAGKEVELCQGEAVLGRARLSETATGEIVLPMPPVGRPYGQAEVWSEGKRLDGLTISDYDAARRAAFDAAPLMFLPAVFTGEKLPPCDFAQPAEVEEIAGRYRIKVTYYDADYNEVQNAQKPGRYGAIVEITAENGWQNKRFITLYCQPAAINWNGTGLAVSGKPPTSLRIDAQIVAEQKETLDAFVRRRFNRNITQDSDLAVLLAALQDTKLGQPTYLRYSPAFIDRDWWYGLKKKTGNQPALRYIENLPAGYNDDPNKKWPLVIFLHGSGEIGSDLEKLKKNGPPAEVARGKQFPFILISPQAPERFAAELASTWHPLQLNEFIDELVQKYRVDTDRITMTGLSMGGGGTWDYARQYGDRLAAIAPIAIWGEGDDVETLKTIPAWYFYGGSDSVVIGRVPAFVKALRAAGANTRITEYPEAGHAQTWIKAYNEPDFYTWLLSHKRSDRIKP